ncbi:hypothetical protein RUM44_006640 [Polyplax serrata]|uniref:Uncharacterized protein n=1 Tax=Polyplax serrata TaxID=468196 RepID=A0ABR1AIP9_POLSC
MALNEVEKPRRKVTRKKEVEDQNHFVVISFSLKCNVKFSRGGTRQRAEDNFRVSSLKSNFKGEKPEDEDRGEAFFDSQLLMHDYKYNGEGANVFESSDGRIETLS